MGRHEQLPSWAATSDSAPNLPRALRRRRKSTHLDGGPNAPPELAPPDFACSASNETNKLEPTFGLHSEMDESRRLKVVYPTAFPRELAEFQVSPRRCQRVGKMGVAARTVVKIIKKTPATTAGGGQAQPASCSEEEGRHGPTFYGTQGGRKEWQFRSSPASPR